ncbi:MAG: M36 family metallopeptidase, partial [Chloroflexota bacterium]|nr:M36 family metallopeptidase [Chloroflexota bacterium]
MFARGPLAGPSYVKAVAFPTKDGARTAYRVQFVKAQDEAWDVVVDASSGAVLYRESLVEHESDGTVYENYPGAPKGGTPVNRSFGPTPESPSGYIDPTGVAGTGVTTLGNNASTYANYSNFIGPIDQGPRPVSPTGSFNYVYTNQWAATKGQTVPPSYVEDLNPAATNLFYQHNRIHDEFYGFGFTESAGNFQVDNAGGGGQGGDPILGLVHAGAVSGGAPTYTGRDNAYMLTLDDGIPPWSGMFLWEPIDDAFEGPHSDGNFDASVIEHEYAHGLSNRYVAGGSALGSHQSGSMGEGWSDWYALNHLYTAGLASTAVVGQHVTGNTARGIRNWDYDQNPTTFGDIGYDITGPEVHSDGEIWTATLWDLRKALVARHGATKGADVAARLVTDGMPLTAPYPSFLDSRDGILAADVDRNHGANTDLIWSVFAKRGAGASAISRTGDDIDPTPAFDNAAASRNGLLSVKVVNASTGAGVANAKVIIGRFEARVTPVARTSSTGGAGAQMVAGSYPVTIQA